MVTRIGIIGNGVVGNALGKVFEEQIDGYDDNGDSVDTYAVYYYDKEQSKRTHGLNEIIDTCGFIFLCLPTPFNNELGGLDTTSLQEMISVHLKDYRKPIIIKSTVPVGFTTDIAVKTKKTNIFHCPEFLNSRTAVKDALDPHFIAIGAPAIHEDKHCRESIKALMEKLHDCPIVYRASEVTELTKLVMNSFFVVKNAFFNEVYELCNIVDDIPYEQVAQLLAFDPRVGSVHTQVPGPDGKLGYGGSCLPKDSKELFNYGFNNLAVTLSVLQKAITMNQYYRGDND